MIVEHILSWDKYKNAKNVMLFYPLEYEISLLSLLNYKDKAFYFPVTDDEIYPVRYSEESGFKTGKFSILEPIGEKLVDLNKLDLIFIPALAADKLGYRLGYGKGFYDRFLLKISTKTTKVVPVANQLYTEKLITESHDKKSDFVITENGIHRTLTYMAK